MFEFKLPDLGEGIHEGELLAWHVKQGDFIQEDEPLCDVETDKATVTIPSPRSGIIHALHAEAGDTIHVDHVIVVIDEGISEGSNSGDEQAETNQSDPKEKKELHESIEEVHHNKKESDVPDTKAPAAPATRRVAREMGINIQKVTGSGPGGRVIVEDLQAFKTEEKGQVKTPESSEVIEKLHQSGDAIPFLKVAELPDFELVGPVEREPLRSLRKKVAVKTTSSMILVPHVAHMEECDVTDLEVFRKNSNESKSNDKRLTLMAFVIRAVSSLLKKYPTFNASLDPHRMEIVYKKFYNIGFAADTPKGLMIPVIRDTADKSISVIAREIRSLAEKGRDESITVSELTGGTFTITNVGSIGGTGVIPTINYPESAILGMGKVRKKPVVRGDEIVARDILPVTLAFDHRVADGAQAARFVNDLKEMLEDISVFLTEM